MEKQKKRKHIYPGIKETNQQRSLSPVKQEEEPDWIGNAPNYNKFSGWTPEEVLVFHNID